MINQDVRDVFVTPSMKWGGDSLIGVSIRNDDIREAHCKVIHIQDVMNGSPADIAGLVSDHDYILGTP